MTFGGAPDPAWLAVYHYLGDGLPDVAVDVLCAGSPRSTTRVYLHTTDENELGCPSWGDRDRSVRCISRVAGRVRVTAADPECYSGQSSRGVMPG